MYRSTVRSIQRIRLVISLVTLLGGVAQIPAGPVRLESSPLGATGRFGGASVTVSQFIGWRFAIDAPLQVEQVGAHMLALDPGGVFAAIVRLASLDAVPVGAPFLDEEVVASTVIHPTLPSEEIFVPFTATLSPGSYALVFGTGLYGATGAAALPNTDDQPDIPPTDISSFIFWSLPRIGEPLEWRRDLASHMRVVIDGTIPGLPGDYDMDGAIDMGDYELWRSTFGSTTSLAADGNQNGRVDPNDFTIWRDRWSLNPAGPSTAVPEPSIVASILGLIVSSVDRSRRERGGANQIFHHRYVR